MAIISKSFTAVGNGIETLLKHSEAFDYAVSGTFVGTVILERTTKGGTSWERVASFTAAASGRVTNESPARANQVYRFRCSAYTSGTIVTSLTSANLTAAKLMIPAAGQSKAGATAGWVVAAAANTALVTVPASQTGSTLVIPVTGLNVGDKVVGFHLVGQVESAGNTVTIDADLRKHTAAAADVADASVGAMTQLALTADAILSSSNTRKAGLEEVITEDETLYVLVTATTAASTDIALQGVAIEVVRA